ncbi:MAG: DUF427 domain-containing protein [Deltaproteobacteria bacterium]
MAKATFNQVVIAESDACEMVEGNPYFPIESVKQELLEPVDKTTFCPWKGTANYYDVVVNGERAAAGAWYYADPKPAAANIKGHVAFWNGVVVEP